MRLFNALICFIRGHDIYPTGRELIMLYQVECYRCHRLFCCHAHDGMLPWCQAFEELFTEREQEYQESR